MKRLFKKKDKGDGDPAAGASGSSPPPAVPMKGDLAVRPYRKQTNDARKQKERAAFEAKLKQISSGYVSSRV